MPVTRQFLITATLTDDADPESAAQVINNAILYERDTTDLVGLCITPSDEDEPVVTVELLDAPPNPNVVVDALAAEIRRVDGNHTLGAGALAEALMPFLCASGDEATLTPEQFRAFTELGAQGGSYQLFAEYVDQGLAAVSKVIDTDEARAAAQEILRRYDPKAAVEADDGWCARCATYGCSPGCPDGDPITVPAPMLAAVLTNNPDPAVRSELTELLRQHYIGDEDHRWGPAYEARPGTVEVRQRGEADPVAVLSLGQEATVDSVMAVGLDILYRLRRGQIGGPADGDELATIDAAHPGYPETFPEYRKRGGHIQVTVAGPPSERSWKATVGRVATRSERAHLADGGYAVLTCLTTPEGTTLTDVSLLPPE